MNDQTENPESADPENDDELEINGESDKCAETKCAETGSNPQGNAESLPHDEPQLDDEATIAHLTAEVQDLKDKVLRARAETENTRRIATREKQDASKYALTNFARDILRVADNLGFAMMSVTEEARKSDQNLDNLYVGIDMTMKELLNVFGAHGIKPVPAEGQPFDHNFHEAVQQLEDSSVPANTVMKMLRGGYMLQDRLLRPAQVIVSTGGPAGDGPAGAKKQSASDKTQNPTENPKQQAPGQNIDQET